MIDFSPNDFRKSSFSDPNQSCVEVAQRAGLVQVRDSKNVFGGTEDGRLVFSTSRFVEFLGRVPRP